MAVSRRSAKLQLRLANASFVLLFLVAIGLLHWVGQEFHLQFDWTEGAKNSLSAASVAAVKRLHEPVQVIAYASLQPQLRRSIREFVGRYQVYKPDIALEFVNPDTDPEKARQAGVRFDGEVVVQYQGSHETLLHLDEDNMTNALVRLGQHGERWLVFLTGHGERSPEREANFDLSLWAKQLHKRGFKTTTLNLADNAQIPRNTAVLIIAGPRVQLLPGEVKAIEQYLDGGGNLLWLGDPGPLYGLEPIAELLDIAFEPGVIVDPGSERITGNATAIVVTHYSDHPSVRDFNNITLFPAAVGITVTPSKNWQSKVLFDTRPEAWSETGPLGGPVRFDKGKDIPGPLNLAVALTRQQNGKSQRVVVTGDGDFLSNRFLGNGINVDLGVSLISWLSQADEYVSIPVRVRADRTLQLTTTSRLLIGGGFLFVLPLFLIGSGLLIWLRRRRR